MSENSDKKIIRTRIAPSPTGEFHIGSLRTLLYNFAWAKKNKGQFLIRIEDTDRTRFVPGATNRMLEVIKEYGFDWDEGPVKGGEYGPYVQSERLNIYREYIDRLLTSGHAYRCFCTEDRLNKLREEYQSSGRKFKYDRFCLSLGDSEIDSKIEAGESFVVRMRVPSDETVTFEDVILGKIEFSSNEIDDQILIKSDGFPTYHFAVVVDDYLMKISHVLRGPEWLTSTPKHILLYQFFGFEAPKFGHLPNLKSLGSNKKLSKRDGNTAAVDYLKDGYLPEALINFLMFLGWNPGTEREFYNLNEFINDFSIERIHKSDLVTFNTDKLNWYNSEYLKKLSDKEVLNKLKYWSSKFNVSCLIDELEKEFNQEELLKIIRLTKERMVNFSEFDKNVDYYLRNPQNDLITLGKYSDKSYDVLKFFYESLKNEDNFEFEYLDNKLHSLVRENNFSMKEYFMTLRICITGESVTPPIIEIISILGKEKTLQRLESSLDNF